MKKKGKLFVVSAPSGSGKTTLCKKLLDDDLGLEPSISTTTRPPRPGEKDGVDYNFVSEEEFRIMVKKKSFLEYEENFGYLYGTSKNFVKKALAQGKNILLSIDVKGAMKVRKAYPGKSVFIFIMPPSMGTLRSRLVSRMSEAPRAITKRLDIAKKEIGYKDRYDYIIINDKLGSAYRRLKKVVSAELN